MMEKFLEQPEPILDVRSPGEFFQGHIPGACNMPLFSDEERAEVGCCYKKIGPKEAQLLGLKFAVPKIPRFIAFAEEQAPQKKVRLHCWRGGMRSASAAKFLILNGFKVDTLEGGYKRFRRWALEKTAEKYPLLILGGMTGVGKTEVLHALREKGEQVLDLEALASHRGSSFGALPLPQPTNEQFENRIACALARFDKNRPVWVEDESRKVGSRQIPAPLFDRMRQAPLYIIEKPRDERFELLKREYGNTPLPELEAAVLRLEKRLGGARTKEVISSLHSGKLREAAEIVLDYYDKAYRYSLSLRPKPLKVLKGRKLSAAEWAERLLREKSG